MRARVILFGLLGFLALAGFECGKPTEPPVSQDSWNILLASPTDTGSMFLVMNSTDFAIVDSFHLPYPSNRPFLDCSNSLLYLENVFSTVVVDCRTHDQVNTVPGFAVEHISSNGQVLGAIKVDTPAYTVKLAFLNPRDYSVIYESQQNNTDFAFSPDGNLCYAVDQDDTVRVYGVSTASVETLYAIGLPTEWSRRAIAGTSDTAIAAIYMENNVLNGRIVLLNPSSGSIIFDTVMTYSGGDIIVTSDESEIYWTAPGFLSGGNPQHAFYGVSLTTRSQIPPVHTLYEPNDSTTYYIPISSMLSIGGSDYVLASPNGDGDKIVVLNTQNHTLNHVTDIPGDTRRVSAIVGACLK